MKKVMFFVLVAVAVFVFSEGIDTWERRYGTDLRESAKQIVRLNDGNYLINASRIVEGGYDNIWVIAVDGNGDSLWTKTVGEGIVNWHITDMDPSDSVHVFVTMKSYTSTMDITAYLSKRNNDFDEIWTKTYEPEVVSLGVSTGPVISISDSGCLYYGSYSVSHSHSGSYLEKLDQDGNRIVYHELEQQINDSTFANVNRVMGIIRISGYIEDEYVVVGNMENFEEQYPYISVYGEDLELLNKVVFDNKNYYFCGIDTIKNGFAVYGDKDLFDIDRSLRYSSWFVELSPTIHSVKETIDDNLFVGTTSKTYKLSKDGEIIWEKDFGGTSLVLTDDGGCIVVGSKFNDVWICKFDQDGNFVNINNYVGIVEGYELHQNYPNPFNPATSISYSLAENADVQISIYDATGSEVAVVFSGRQAKGSYSVDFNAEGMTSGIYFYRLSVDGKAVQSRKMLFLK